MIKASPSDGVYFPNQIGREESLSGAGSHGRDRSLRLESTRLIPEIRKRASKRKVV